MRLETREEKSSNLNDTHELETVFVALHIDHTAQSGHLLLPPIPYALLSEGI